MSYVTGAHNLKIGYGGVSLVSDLENHTNDLNLAYTVSNGVPISLTQSLLPYTTSYRTRNMAYYVQDQWKLGRMTLQGALRFDRELELLARTADPAVGLPGERHHLSANAWRDRLQGSVAARRRRLRRVRQRKDGRQGELRQIPGADEQQQQLHPVEPDRPHRDDDDADLDRRQQQLRAGLQPDESAGQCRMRSDERPHVRHDGADDRRDRPEDSQRLGRALERLADWRIDPAADPPAPVGRSGLPAPMAEQLHGDRQPARRPGRFHAATASRRRPIRVCLAAAATPSTGCTTSSRASSARPATTSHWLAISASSISATTGCWSTSARGSVPACSSRAGSTRARRSTTIARCARNCRS